MNTVSISGDCQPSASLIESRDRKGVSTVKTARKTHPDLSELQKALPIYWIMAVLCIGLRSEISLKQHILKILHFSSLVFDFDWIIKSMGLIHETRAE